MTLRWMMVLALGIFVQPALPQDAPVLKDFKEKISYALGTAYGSELKKQSVDIDSTLFFQGLKDSLAGGKMLLTPEEIRTVLGQFQDAMVQKQFEAMKAMGDKNKKEGEAFLAANKTKEGVITLESGLQYKVLQTGEGKKPTIDDTVVCHYRGTLINGNEFDSSFKRNQPATFAVKGVIKGWTEALQLMTVGSKWQLFVPSALAYAERGMGGVIEPNATLIFEVELISIKDKQ